QPIFFTGFIAFIAPWKTIAMSFQRWPRAESSPPARMLRPSTSTSPASEAFGGSRPISARIVVVLPQPDSPTRPKRSPSSRAKLTPAAACTGRPCGRSDQTCRSRTSSRLKWPPTPLPPSPQRAQPPPAHRQVGGLQPRVERVLDRLAEQEAADDQPRDHEAVRDDRPPGPVADRGALERVLQDRPPGGDRRVLQAEERK